MENLGGWNNAGIRSVDTGHQDGDNRQDARKLLLEEMRKRWPGTLEHEHHREHELVMSIREVYRCDGCGERGEDWSYSCEECDFDMHPRCGLWAKCAEMARGWPDKLPDHHHAHAVAHRGDHGHHPCELVKTRVDGHYWCVACAEKGYCWSFQCRSCGFVLHPECALAERDVGRPERIKHELHREHELLLRLHGTGWSGSYWCTSCAEEGQGPSFCCQGCGVFMHPRCAVRVRPEGARRLWPEFVEHALHEEHYLVRTRRSSYACDGCGDAGSGWSYHCMDCDFDLHPKCGMEPQTSRGGARWSARVISGLLETAVTRAELTEVALPQQQTAAQMNLISDTVNFTNRAISSQTEVAMAAGVIDSGQKVINDLFSLSRGIHFGPTVERQMAPQMKWTVDTADSPWAGGIHF